MKVGDLVSSAWHTPEHTRFGIIVDIVDKVRVRQLDPRVKYVVMWGNGQMSSRAARDLIPFTREMQ